MNPNYYAIIPATVRYSPDLCANAKLLYGEITALCSKEGYCWATNAYFKELYGVTSTSVSQWVQQLRKAGFIRVEIEPDGGNARKIWLTEGMKENLGGIQEKANTSIRKVTEGSVRKPEDSITEDIITKNDNARSARFIPPTIEECREEAKKDNIPESEGEKFFHHYDAVEWKRGKIKISKWRSAWANWKLNIGTFSKSPVNGTTGKPLTPEQADYAKKIAMRPY